MFIRKDSPDVLYLVKPAEQNEELKYSLRSLKNLNHGKVFIAGYVPAWVEARYETIPVNQDGEKYENVRKNLLTALNDPRLSDDFVLMNDDFFIMQPTKKLPVLRRLKNLDHYIKLFEKVDANSYYVNSMRHTRDLLREWGVRGELSSYELHIPMTFNKHKLLALIDRLPKHYPVHLRTLYGNYYQIGGDRIRDVKEIRNGQGVDYEGAFLSTIDESFETGEVGSYIRRKLAKVLIFSHANDSDGVLSVLLAQLTFPYVDYVLTNSPQRDILEFIKDKDVDAIYDYIFITDLYPGRPVLEALPNAYWFDHKQNSIDKISQHALALPNADIRLELNGRPTSASELFYNWLVNESLLDCNLESVVGVVRKQDTWDFS